MWIVTIYMIFKQANRTVHKQPRQKEFLWETDFSSSQLQRTVDSRNVKNCLLKWATQNSS